jgi:tetratricopeptide (TPR) repeat protein
LKKKELNFANLNYNLELHEAHYNKHLWRSNEALIILRNIETQSFSGLVDSLGILTSKYFINDIYIPFSNESTLEVYRRNYIKAQESTLSKSDDEILKLHRHEAIYKYYFEKSSYDELINISSRVISSYKARNSRLLANAFFIRAEIHRIFKNYEQAIIDYQKCMYVTDDNNIKIQINVMLYYLDQIKKISSIKFPKYLSKEDIILLCKNKNKYGEILISKINSIELNDPEYNKIINIFDTRIMTIL